MFLKQTFLKAKTYFNQIIIGTDFQFLVFFRISIALIAISDILTMGDDFKLFFSEKSTIIPQELTYLFTEYFNYLNPIYQYILETNNITNFYNVILKVYFLSLIFLVFGFCTRFAAFIALILQLIIFKSFALFNFGYDHFLTISLFYCLVFPVGKFYSVDNKILKRPEILKNNFNYQNILKIHLFIVYLFAGLAKIISITWWNGEAVWRSISSIYDELFKIHPLILAMSGIVTVFLEVFYPFLISYNKTKKITIILVILMHMSIGFIMQLPLFAAIMIVWNISAYYDNIISWYKN